MQRDDESEDIQWFKMPRKYLNRYIPEDMAFDHHDMLLEASTGFECRWNIVAIVLPEYFTLGQIQDIYEIIWEVV